VYLLCLESVPMPLDDGLGEYHVRVVIVPLIRAKGVQTFSHSSGMAIRRSWARSLSGTFQALHQQSVMSLEKLLKIL